MINKISPSYQFFLDGRHDAIEDGKMHTYIADVSVMYRLGFLYETSPNNPKRLTLIKELCREFAMMDNDFSNYVEISLLHHYSHRILRSTMAKIGYHIPSGHLDSSEFHAWRVR